MSNGQFGKKKKPMTLTLKQRKQKNISMMKGKNGHFVFLVQSTLTKPENVSFIFQEERVSVMEIHAKVKLQQVGSMQRSMNNMRNF